MAEPPALTIRRNFPRPGSEVVARFKGAASGHVADAMGRRGALGHAVRCYTRAAAFAGTALTVRSRERDNLAPWAALRFARPGDVLVVEAGLPVEAAVIGDVVVGSARNAGIAAVVTDGFIRDVAGIDGIGIPVFATGVTPNSPHKTGPGTIGLPIVIGGQAIHPGDIVVGDADGVVVVPQDRIGDVLQELEAIRAKEAEMDRLVASGAKEPKWLDEALRTMTVSYLD